MTEPTYEVNQEALSNLTISDLISLMELSFKVSFIKDKAKILFEITSVELDKRINDIIIF